MKRVSRGFRAPSDKRSVELNEVVHDAALDRAHALEQAGNLYIAWRDYNESAATFEHLVDTTPFLQAASTLAAVLPRTPSRRLTTRSTVASDTPAVRATSWRVALMRVASLTASARRPQKTPRHDGPDLGYVQLIGAMAKR